MDNNALIRQDLVHKFHYTMLDWVTQQAKSYPNKNAVVLGARNSLLHGTGRH